MAERHRRWISAQQIVDAYDKEEITMTLIQASMCQALARKSEKSQATAQKWKEARDTIMNRPDRVRYNRPAKPKQ